MMAWLILFLVFIGHISISYSFQPSIELPPLLQFINGTQITKASQWPDRRIELKQLLDQYILGTKVLI